jgi:di/tricarboxylate transporter
MPGSSDAISTIPTMPIANIDHAIRLRQEPLFAGLPDSAISRLLARLQPFELEAGASLYARDASAEFLYLIEEGCIRITTPGGRAIELNGSRCGEEAASDVTTYLCSATAITPVKAIRIPRAVLGELAVTAPSLPIQALLGLSEELSGEKLQGAVSMERPVDPPLHPREIAGWFSVIAVPPAIYFLADSAGLIVEAAVFLAILSATVMMWLFSLTDEFIPPLLAIAAVLIVGLVPAQVALAGFSSPTMILLVGVYALAVAISSSGLSYRFSLWLLIHLPDTPFWHQAALLLSGYLLSPIMPSQNARLSLTLPFYKDIVDGLDLPRKSGAATALMASTFAGAMLFSAMLPTSKSANLTTLTMLPAQLQTQYQGLFWLVAAAVAALTLSLMHFLCLGICFGRIESIPLPKPRLRQQHALLGPLRPPEKAVMAGFLFFLTGAGTSDWHRIAPAWIAAFLLAGFLLMGLVSRKDFQQKIDWPFLFFLLGVEGLSQSIAYLKLDAALGAAVSAWVEFIGGSVPVFVLVVLVVTLLLRLFLPIQAGMVVSAVILIPIAEAQQINPWIAVFLTAMFSDMWFWRYQCSPYLQVLGNGYGPYFDHTPFMYYNFLTNIARIVAVYLSIPYWTWLKIL